MVDGLVWIILYVWKTMEGKDKATEIALRNARVFASMDLNALVNDSSVTECEKCAQEGMKWMMENACKAFCKHGCNDVCPYGYFKENCMKLYEFKKSLETESYGR